MLLSFFNFFDKYLDAMQVTSERTLHIVSCNVNAYERKKKWCACADVRDDQ